MNLNFKTLEESLREQGVAQIGYSDLRGIVPERYNAFPYGITLVWRLLDGVLDEVQTLNSPTYSYFQHYRSVNAELDRLTLWLATKLEQAGFRALPIGASQSVHDMGNYSGAFQHKTAAVEINQTGCFGRKIFGRQDKTGDLLAVIASDFTCGHIQFLIPPEGLRRFHVGYGHGQKLLADGRRKEIPGEELPQNSILFHRLCSFGFGYIHYIMAERGRQ